jgi:hypothetical protein
MVWAYAVVVTYTNSGKPAERRPVCVEEAESSESIGLIKEDLEDV